MKLVSSGPKLSGQRFELVREAAETGDQVSGWRLIIWDINSAGQEKMRWDCWEETLDALRPSIEEHVAGVEFWRVEPGDEQVRTSDLSKFDSLDPGDV